MRTFASAIGTIEWAEETDGMLLRFGGREHRLLWETLDGAGTVTLAEDAAANANARDGVALDAPAHYLVIAPGSGANYLLRIPIPSDVADAADLVESVRTHAAAKWRGDLPPEDYKTPFAPAGSALPAWLAPTVILVFIGASALLVTACMGLTLLQSGEWRLFSWQFVLGVVVWVAIVGAILYAYRRAWLRQ